MTSLRPLLPPGRTAAGLVSILALAAGPGCGGGDSGSPADDAPVLQESYDSVRAHLDQTKYFDSGEWKEDYGDASAWGPSFDLAYWKATGLEAHRAQAIAALDYNKERVEGATGNLLAAMDDLEDVSMALLSLVEAGLYLDAAQEPKLDGYRAAADGLMEVLDQFSSGMGDYLEITAGEFAATTYGPTSISSLIALVHLEHALAYPTHDADGHVERAEQVLANIHTKAWDPDLGPSGAYRFAPEDERHMLYPNATMLIAWARAAQLTGDESHLQRVRAARAAIEPMRETSTKDHFHSPYSAEVMGATDPDYSTLSSQNYLMLGLWIAHEVTGESEWTDDIAAIVGFIERTLLTEDGRILHHWMDGAAAKPEHLEYYCSGCNLQTLYILTVMSGAAGGA